MSDDTGPRTNPRAPVPHPAKLPEWRRTNPGIEKLTIAVMGCIVNGPGESKAADIGISLPGNGEDPRCPVFVKGRHATTLEGDAEDIAAGFVAIIDEHVASFER